MLIWKGSKVVKTSGEGRFYGCLYFIGWQRMHVTKLVLTWVGWPNVKNLRRLAFKFDLYQSERKSLQLNSSTCKAWPNGVASRPQFLTNFYSHLDRILVHCKATSQQSLAVPIYTPAREMHCQRIFSCSRTLHNTPYSKMAAILVFFCLLAN